MLILRLLTLGMLAFILFCQMACQLTQYSPCYFPQGVASGDPQPDKVMLWTRIEPLNGGQELVNAKVEVSQDSSFRSVFLTDTLSTSVKQDFTVRYLATGLEAGRKYYYRFITGKDTSETGRTFTAPVRNEESKLNMAMLACQSYEQGFFGTLKRLIEEDKSAPEEEQIQLILHLGDFIYEVVGDVPDQDNSKPNWLTDRHGNPRSIPPFPVGLQRPYKEGNWKSGAWQPLTVADYRHLYKVYLSNPVYKEARARWPFICTWDDHEFTDGNYQTETYAREAMEMPGLQKVKLASNQAWFEFIPSILSESSSLGNVENPAFDYQDVEVDNVALGDSLENDLLMEPNNLKAINSMKIYRNLSWGKDIDFIITDTKSYQLPGKTVLGHEQMDWFTSVLSASRAKWKLWGNSEPIAEVKLNFQDVPELKREADILYRDSWVQAETETNEILEFIQKEEISGFVSLSGDYHIQMANLISHNEKPLMADISVTSMSAFADFFWLDRKGQSYGHELIEKAFSYSLIDSLKQPNINTTAMYGISSALNFAETGELDMGTIKTPNPGLQYFDCEHNGYVMLKISSDSMNVSFVNTENARKDFEERGASVVSRVTFLLAAWKMPEGPQLGSPKIEGKVFPVNY